MKKYFVIIVEADAILSKSIADFLEAHTYRVTTFQDVDEAIEYLYWRGSPNVILLGMNLPAISGFEAANRFKLLADVPIIFLLERADQQNLVEGLKRFAEDFVTAPIDLHELETRIQIVLGRLPILDLGDEEVIRIDALLSIDFARKRAFVAGRMVRLTPTEAILLYNLIRNAPRVVQSDSLIPRVWPGEAVFEDNLRVHIHRLRRKLEADSHHPRYIRTVRGVGYRFSVRPVDWQDEED